MQQRQASQITPAKTVERNDFLPYAGRAGMRFALLHSLALHNLS